MSLRDVEGDISMLTKKFIFEKNETFFIKYLLVFNEYVKSIAFLPETLFFRALS